MEKCPFFSKLKSVVYDGLSWFIYLGFVMSKLAVADIIRYAAEKKRGARLSVN
jgi:hypothetical protein